jgi:hypothetical protein
MFEAIPSDSENMEMEDTECDVKMCSEKFQPLASDEEDGTNIVEKFETIESDDDDFSNHPQELRTKLTLWWPECADKVLHAMYDSDDKKKSAVKMLLNLFEFKYEQTEPLRLLTQDLESLRFLYVKKIQLVEQYAIEVKNIWCDILRKCATDCKQLIVSREQQLNLLKLKKDDFLQKCEKFNVEHIINDEFMKSIGNIERDFNLKMSISKMNYKVSSPHEDICNIQHLNAQIRKLKKKLDASYNDSVKQLDNSFEQECKNIDYEISKQLQQECL